MNVEELNYNFHLLRARKHVKPFPITGLTKPAMTDVTSAGIFFRFYLSVFIHIDGISDVVKEQLLRRLKMSRWPSFQLHNSTDSETRSSFKYFQNLSI